MSLRQWLRGLSRQRRRKKAAAENRDQPLREFVYLDEVSVFSLLASRIGALATDFTQSESSSLATEVKGSAGVSAPVAKANVSSAVKASQTSGTQVMRKSTVQSTFKELYGYVRDSLVLRPPNEGENPPSAERVAADLAQEADTDSVWALDSARMKRGQLLEVEVELDADESFRASTIMSTLLEFLEEMSELPDSLDREGLMNAVTGSRLLDKLLAGLVPLRGRVIDYSHVTVGDRELIVHSKVLSQQPALAEHAVPLYVVGVAEEDLFWRDIRRVLFSGARYRMLCRLGRDGVQLEWTPVKLMHVLEGAVPALRGIIDEIPTFLANMGAEEQGEGRPAQVQRQALLRYAEDVTAIYEHPLNADELAARGLPTVEQCEANGTVEARSEPGRV